MKHRKFLSRAAALAILTGSAIAATPPGPAAVVPSTVGPITAAISQVNYDESGAVVNGFLIGANTLLTFLRPVCGGIGSLGKASDTVTYSGIAQTFGSGFQNVFVTSFTNGTITYPPATALPKPTAYPATSGSITQLNYSENGVVNGFVFTPTSGSAVFVDLGETNPALAAQLTTGTTVSVTGMLEAPPVCAPAGTISEVDATSLTIGTKTYAIGGHR